MEIVMTVVVMVMIVMMIAMVVVIIHGDSNDGSSRGDDGVYRW